MTTLPSWIEERTDPELNKKLTQRHVVETMIQTERPFFSAEQIRARVQPNVSKETVRNRLNELHEIDIIAAETYPESITLYYINYPESNWPLSPEGKRALTTDSPLDRLSTRGFLTMQDSAGIRTLVLAGLQLTLVLFAFGGILTVFGVDLGSTGSDFVLWDTAFDLLGVCLLLLVTEWATRWVRSRYGPLNTLPTA